MPQSISMSSEPPAAENVPSRVGNGAVPVSWPQAPVDNVPIPAAQEAAGHQAERRGDDDPAEEVEPRPAQDQADADPDEDERPERPQPTDLVVVR